MKTMNPIQAKCEIFKEDDRHVALCPELDVSSFGETIQEAKASLEEVLLAFLEECERMNTPSSAEVCGDEKGGDDDR